MDKRIVMKTLLVNFAIFFGLIGFIGVLFLIIAGYIGCCTEMTTQAFYNLVIGFLAVSVVIFGICMYNNCCHAFRKKAGNPE